MCCLWGLKSHKRLRKLQYVVLVMCVWFMFQTRGPVRRRPLLQLRCSRTEMMRTVTSQTGKHNSSTAPENPRDLLVKRRIVFAGTYWVTRSVRTGGRVAHLRIALIWTPTNGKTHTRVRLNNPQWSCKVKRNAPVTECRKCALISDWDGVELKHLTFIQLCQFFKEERDQDTGAQDQEETWTKAGLEEQHKGRAVKWRLIWFHCALRSCVWFVSRRCLKFFCHQCMLISKYFRRVLNSDDERVKVKWLTWATSYLPVERSCPPSTSVLIRAARPCIEEPTAWRYWRSPEAHALWPHELNSLNVSRCRNT